MIASTIESPKAEKPRKKKPGERGPEIPVMVKMRIRNLYFNSGLPVRVIASQVGLSEPTIHKMAQREGWTVEKQSHKRKLISEQNAQGDELRGKVMAELANESIELAGSALKVTRSGLDQNDLDGAKQAQAASSTLKNLVTTARLLTDPGVAGESSVTNFNLFFAAAVPVSEPKKVTEIETVSKAPADSQ